MPVTARLSKKFYDALGEDIAQELVDWFNQVDATYRADLRELNELNFARFDARLEQRIAELRAELRTGLAELRTELRAEIKASHANLIKWMFAFWAGTTVPILGVMVAFLR